MQLKVALEWVWNVCFLNAIKFILIVPLSGCYVVNIPWDLDFKIPLYESRFDENLICYNSLALRKIKSKLT